MINSSVVMNKVCLVFEGGLVMYGICRTSVVVCALRQFVRDV